MPQSRTPLRAILLAVSATAALAAGGCSLVSGPEPQAVACPTYGMLRDGAAFTRYREGAPHDPTNVELSAEIVDVSAGCVLQPEPRHIEMTLGTRIVAERGPAAASPEMRFAYIVAVTDAERNILNRRVYPLAATFDGTARQAGFEEVLYLDFPLAEGQSAGDFRVYVSLQLRPEELAAQE